VGKSGGGRPVSTCTIGAMLRRIWEIFSASSGFVARGFVPVWVLGDLAMRPSCTVWHLVCWVLLILSQERRGGMAFFVLVDRIGQM
jgi:hypothetical protein